MGSGHSLLLRRLAVTGDEREARGILPALRAHVPQNKREASGYEAVPVICRVLFYRE